tara:strand:+ start:27 stop:242 length:216 start_codon:yes stop_codon:yes gene_type:complete
MNYLLIKFIRLYQITLSVFVGQHCRFTPTCSNYAIEALKNHGLAKGVALSTKRVCKCHPWSEGGIDEVPRK